MQVLVTRPQAQAAAWVARLAERGIAASALPLIDIAPPADPAAVEAAWRSLDACRLVVFVSPNAAGCFFAHRPQGQVQQAWPDGLPAAAVGPGTAQVLRDCGVPAAAVVEPDADAAQFDSEALWLRLRHRDWSGARVLIVRGDGGRAWLADTLARHGAQVRFVSAYRRMPPRFDDAQRRLLDAALVQPARHLWFFSSSEAIDHLAAACPGAAWQGAWALATHPRIAERARQQGFGHVHACRPTLDAVVACIQSIAS